MKILFTITLLALVLAAAVLSVGAGFINAQAPPPFNYPDYQQCDPTWGSDKMYPGTNGTSATICQQGCAMTSTANALAGMGVTLEGALVTPQTLNTFLRANNGYYCSGGDCNNLNFTAVEVLTNTVKFIGETEKSAFSDIAANLASRAVSYVAHVRNKSHFVLLIKPLADGSGYFVHDPFFNVSSYTYDDISDTIRWKWVRYPLYKQCNSTSWGNNPMGANGQTVCQVGCLMSSTSMAIAGSGIRIPGYGASNPGSLNAWIRANHGYTPNSALDESIIPKIAPTRIRWPADGMHTTNDIPLTTIKQYLDADVPRIVIANVMHGHHFVLVVGYQLEANGTISSSLWVNDPGFEKFTYDYNQDVVGWRLFDMIPSY